MESDLATTFGTVHETPAVHDQKVAPGRAEKDSWLMPGCLFAWLCVGGFLSWLVADFGQAYGETHSTGISLLVFSMFILSAFAVSLVRRAPSLRRVPCKTRS